jgi:dihydrodipicolinate synthase/N-acetylneuraminate lyase
VVVADARTERQLAISTTRRALDEGGFSHVPIIAGTGQMSLKETLQTTREAQAAGAEYALVIAPHYWPDNMTKPVLIDYFTRLADQSPLPIII